VVAIGVEGRHLEGSNRFTTQKPTGDVVEAALTFRSKEVPKGTSDHRVRVDAVRSSDRVIGLHDTTVRVDDEKKVRRQIRKPLERVEISQRRPQSRHVSTSSEDRRPVLSQSTFPCVLHERAIHVLDAPFPCGPAFGCGAIESILCRRPVIAVYGRKERPADQLVSAQAETGHDVTCGIEYQARRRVNGKDEFRHPYVVDLIQCHHVEVSARPIHR
jgi:hypothetical protein